MSITINSENAKQIRKPMEVYCTFISQEEGNKLSISIPDTSGIKIRDTNYLDTLVNNNIAIRKLTDLANGGFVADGTASFFDGNTVGSQSAGKLGIQTNIGGRVVMNITGTKRINSLTIAIAEGTGTITANNVAYPTSRLIVIPVNAQSVQVTAQADPDSRLVIASIIAGIGLEFTNENLVSCVLSLRSNLDIINPSWEVSDIEINAYYPYDIAEAISNVGDNVPITYYAGYDGDYSEVRTFYLSEKASMENNVVTIKGEDASSRLEDYTVPVTGTPINNNRAKTDLYNRFCQIVQSAIGNSIPIRREPEPPVNGLDTKAHLLLWFEHTARDTIANIMNLCGSTIKKPITDRIKWGNQYEQLGQLVSTDTSKAYTKGVPQGANYTRVRKIIGESVVNGGILIDATPTNVVSSNGQSLSVNYGTLRSAGNVHDELDLVNSKIIRRVGQVDLRDMVWAKRGGYYESLSLVGLIRPPINNNISVVALCSVYGVQPWYQNNDKAIGVSTGGYVGLVDTSIADVSEINGVLNYELAEPYEEKINVNYDTFKVCNNIAFESKANDYGINVPLTSDVAFWSLPDEIDAGSFFPRFIDAGIPTLRWHKPYSKWIIREEDCASVVAEYDRNINKIESASADYPLVTDLTTNANALIETVSVTPYEISAYEFDGYYMYPTVSNAKSVIQAIPSRISWVAGGGEESNVYGRKINIITRAGNVTVDRLGSSAVIDPQVMGRIFDGNDSTMLFPNYNNLFDISNMSGSFTFKGDPRMQPRDVFDFVRLDGSIEECTIETITLTHEGGGTHAEITYRKGVC